MRVTQVRPAHLAVRVPVSEAEGLKHANAVHCDGPVSLPRTALTLYMGNLDPQRPAALRVALKVAVSLLD